MRHNHECRCLQRTQVRALHGRVYCKHCILATAAKPLQHYCICLLPILQPLDTVYVPRNPASLRADRVGLKAPVLHQIFGWEFVGRRLRRESMP